MAAVARAAASETSLQAIVSSVQEGDAWGQDTGDLVINTAFDSQIYACRKIWLPYEF